MSDELPTYPQNEILLAGVDFNVDEIQVITSTASSGTFKITFDGEQTAAIAEDAAASAVSTALVALSNINAGDVQVSGNNGGPWSVVFGGQYADTNVPEVTIQDVDLGGGTVTVATTSGGEDDSDGVSIPDNIHADARSIDSPRDDDDPETIFGT
jgi:hypothetical protein